MKDTIYRSSGSIVATGTTVTSAAPSAPCGANEYHVIGGPGAGKTNHLYRKVADALKAGYGPEDLLICSFTDAAAWTAIKRVEPLGVEKTRVRTLHSFAYTAVGGEPKIAEVEGIAKWNRLYQEYRLSERASGNPSTVDDPDQPGDRLIGELQKCRALQMSDAQRSLQVRRFSGAWTQFKAANSYLDFSDLIEKALAEVDTFPGNPRLVFVDEAQDLCPLEVALIRKWAARADWLYMFFDTCQCIYSFKGAAPEMLLNVQPVHREVLDVSRRLPQSVLDAAKRWMKQLPREKVELKPQPGKTSGLVRRESAIKTSQPRELYADLMSNRYIAEGKDVMILTSCSYMLKLIAGVLFAEGIPYGNLYRKDKRDWNPLGRAREGGANSAVDALRAFLRNDPRTFSIPRLWNGSEVLAVAKALSPEQLLDTQREPGRSILQERLEQITVKTSAELRYQQDKANLLGHPLAKWLAKHYGQKPVSQEELRLIFCPEAVEALLAVDLDWFFDHARSGLRRTEVLGYARKVMHRFGRDMLVRTPPVTIGTVHSVKGAEADVVYLFPDLSPAGCESYKTGGKASIIRTFFVGMTRAKEELVLCGASSRKCPIDWIV